MQQLSDYLWKIYCNVILMMNYSYVIDFLKIELKSVFGLLCPWSCPLDCFHMQCHQSCSCNSGLNFSFPYPVPQVVFTLLSLFYLILDLAFPYYFEAMVGLCFQCKYMQYHNESSLKNFVGRSGENVPQISEIYSENFLKFALLLSPASESKPFHLEKQLLVGILSSRYSKNFAKFPEKY